MLIAGVLSGTSLDGIDVAICDVDDGEDGEITVRCRRSATIPFDTALRARILAAYPPAPAGALELSALHALTGEAFGDAVRALAGADVLDAVGSHGITIAHDGDASQSLQIGDAFRIRERTQCTVVYDFRSADTAAGGSGAPLVPFVDALLFARSGPCAALNLGGIANVTILPDGAAFDTGPANLPMDTYVAVRTEGRSAYDRGGEAACAGTIDEQLLERMLDNDAFLARTPPKSAGREQYGVPFVTRWRDALDALSYDDALATLAALTVRSIAAALRRYAPHARSLIVSGGGTHNLAVMDGLRRALPSLDVCTSDVFGIDADAKEAIAFAVLAFAALRERSAGMPQVTGARETRVLGAIAPHNLRSLLCD